MQVNSNQGVQGQLEFMTAAKSADKVTLKAEINGKSYSFTVIKADVGKLSDAELKSQYGEKFAKMAKVAEVVNLQSGEILAEKKDTLSLKGRKDEKGIKEKRETYTEAGKISIKLPKSLSQEQVHQIKEIYQTQVAKAANSQLASKGPIAQDEKLHKDNAPIGQDQNLQHKDNAPIAQDEKLNKDNGPIEQEIHVDLQEIELEIVDPANDQAVKKQAENSANKVETTKVFFGSTFKKLTAGAAKIVWIPKTDESSANLKSEHEGKVIYTPVTDGILNNLLGLKESEIKEEAILQEKMIDKSLEKLGKPMPQFLAVDMKTSFTEDGQFIASAAKALGDMDSLIKNPALTVLQAAKLALGPVKGMSELHKLGYVAADVKSENTLGYVAKPEDGVGDTIVKLADFGKAVEMGADKTKFYSGNKIYAPPERELSQKGDVFGLGMITLRAMEERIFAKTGTSSFENISNESNKSGLRGIEHYRSTHESFAKNRFEFLLPTTKSNMADQERDMKNYVLQFEFEFFKNFSDDPMSDNLKGYIDLLNDTFSSDPRKRPTAAQFEQRYEAFINAVENAA